MAAFDRMFAASDDPWGFRTRWYEHRKRALTLASLPAQRYRSGFEPGCANGELSAALATRCDRLLASDGAAAAVALASARLAGLPHARAEQALLPEGWPDETFDLVVISEVGYYLAEDALHAVAQRCHRALQADATLLACHWRHPIDGCPRDGDAVHAALRSVIGAAPMVCHLEPDFVLEVWCGDRRSVAVMGGLA